MEKQSSNTKCKNGIYQFNQFLLLVCVKYYHCTEHRTGHIGGNHKQTHNVC